MKKIFLLILLSVFFVNSYAQTGCYSDWKTVFEKRGAYTVTDDMYRNVIISFIEGEESFCIYGKVRVENGKIVSIFVQYEDGEFALMDQKFTNKLKRAPGIVNGISEEISNEAGEKFYVLFVDKIKPKKREYKKAAGPGANFK
ncbi:hypothetical protein DNU06_11240 [Putridiphycobacter roseus]|uniref:Uncharacterized protein n=1 Tax=Putridiphycobacter roseus TaxID=2219161 RepID=A0A2W1MZK4_9FLAO|nr:hypothetical protein [Putridiphycobacter roseus]PZE16824.1 hypothetical protein DNU06_11240 [Putridiphycobacter roseus]